MAKKKPTRSELEYEARDLGIKHPDYYNKPELEAAVKARREQRAKATRQKV